MKTISQMTKAELVQLLAARDTQVASLRSELCQARGAIAHLAHEIEELAAQKADRIAQPSYRERVRAWCVAHPHVQVRMAQAGATTKDGTVVVSR